MARRSRDCSHGDRVGSCAGSGDGAGRAVAGAARRRGVGVPGLPAAGRVARGVGADQAPVVRRSALLGQAGAGLGCRASAGFDRRPGSGGQRRQPDRPGFHRRPVRRRVVRGNAAGRPGELADQCRRRRRPDTQRHPGGGRRAVRTAGECADAGGAIDLCAVADRRVAAGRRRRASDRGAGRIRLALSARHDSSRRWPGAPAAAEIRSRAARDRACRSRRGGAAGLLPPQPAEHLHRQTDPRNARRHLREGEEDGGIR